MLSVFLPLLFGILASVASAESYGSSPWSVRVESRGPVSSNSSLVNSTTTRLENNAQISVTQFYELIGSTCKNHISALQTCPKSKAQRDDWLDLSMRVARCTKDIYNTKCNSSDDGSVTKKYPTYNVWVRDHLNMTETIVDQKEGCDYPDYLPILKAATDRSRQIHNPTNFTSLDDSQTICGSMAGEVIITAPVQYVRCVRQKRSPDDVTPCVLSTIDAVTWISLDFFIYHGQENRCKTGDGNFGNILIPMIITFIFELVRFAVDVWLWKRECAKKPEEPPRTFSWVGLCEKIITGFGLPVLVAFIVYGQTFEASVFAIVSILILKPQAASLIAIPAKRMLGAGYGAQLLFVDSLIALAALLVTSYSGLAWIPSFDFSRPQNQNLMSLGLYITFLPMAAIMCIYYLTSAFFLFFLALGILIRWATCSSRVLKWAGSIFLFWWGLIICFALTPIFALFELGWKAYCKRKKINGDEKVFPLAKFFATFFDSSSGHWLMKIGKKLLYYPWCALMLAVFVGRWMALVNLFAIAGDAFCPASWATTVVAYVFLFLSSILIPTALHFFGLSF